MGIRGLQSFMKKHENVALKNHKLMGEKLIIDCSNCSNHIFFSSNINQAYGGDYDQYAMQVEEFFKSLIECNVEPYVICEGGHPTQKFETVYSRFCNKLSTCLDINDRNQSLQRLFPLVGYTVFQNVAQKLGIPVLRCDFEADDEVAALAKEIGAYVLSNDSDFFIYGVPFIVGDSLDLKSIRTDGDITYIPCSLFDAKTFCETVKIREEFLPLLGSVLGNDDIHPRMMQNFYDHVAHLKPCAPDTNRRHKIIISVIRWFSAQNQSFEDVIDEIANFTSGTFSKESKKLLLKSATRLYSSPESSLRAWISPHDPSCPTRKGEADIKHCASSSLPRIDFKAKHFVPPKVKWELECTCENRLESNIMFGCQLPPWFIRAHRLGLVTPMIVDMINLDYLFMADQFVFWESESSWDTLLTLTKRIRGIMWNTFGQSLQMHKLPLSRSFVLPQTPIPHPSSKFEKVESIKSEKEEKGRLPEINSISQSWKQNESLNTGHSEKSIQSELESVNFISFRPIETNSMHTEVKNGVHITKSQEDKDNGDEFSTSFNVKKQSTHKSTIGKEGNDSISTEEIELIALWRNNVIIEDFKRKGLIPALRLFTRKGDRGQRLLIENEPVQAYSCFPTLFEVEKLTESEKRKVFCSVADFKVGFNEELPRNVEFILFSICYWKQTFRADDEENIIAALLMCLIMFCVIDGKCGRVRSHPTYHTVESCAKRVRNLFNSGKLLDPSSVSVAALIQDLTTEECDLANMELLKFHHLKSTNNSNNPLTVQAFSQFLASIFFLNALNSVTGFPFPIVSIDSFWDGRFCYQIWEFFTQCQDRRKALVEVFNQNNRFNHLYTRFYKLVQK